MKVIELNINLLKEYENNPRHNEAAVDKVAESIKEFGFKVPIIIDQNNVIVTGHTRIKAARKLGLKKVPCIIADDLSPEQIKAFRLADNKVSEYATWDEDKLYTELMKLKVVNFDIESFGFETKDIDTSTADIDSIIDKFESEKPTEIIEDDFDTEEAVEEITEPITKLGDVWLLGDHRLMCGDSTKIEDVEKLLDGNKIDMVFTDPPYGMNLDTDYSGMKNNLDFAKDKNFTGDKKYEQGIVDNFSPEMLKLIFDLDIKETFIWGANYFAELIPNRNNGSWIVWDKRANGNDDIEQDYQSDKMYGSCFELCWSKNKHKQDIARIKWAGVFGTEQEFDHKRHHPTQKPIKLATWFLTKYSHENESVLDLFGGSGSTLIACEQLNRQCYTMELDPKYCDVIIKRWETLTGKKAVLIE